MIFVASSTDKSFIYFNIINNLIKSLVYWFVEVVQNTVHKVRAITELLRNKLKVFINVFNTNP